MKRIKNPNKKYRYKNILVLGSGGVLGTAWHLATINRLIANNDFDLDKIDLIIGTSAGSLAASLLTSPLSIEESLNLLKGEEVIINGNSILKPNLSYRSELIRESKIKEYYKYLFKNKKFPKLGFFLANIIATGKSNLEPLASEIDKLTKDSWPEKQIWLISSSMTTHSRVIITKDSSVPLGAAVISSCSIPGLYTPKLYSGHKLMDGGLISALNLDLAFKNKPETITVLAPLSSYGRITPSNTLKSNITVLIRGYQEATLQMYALLAKVLKIKLVIIRPRKSEFKILEQGVMDDSRVEELINVTSSM